MPAITRELSDFVRNALSKGIERKEVSRILTEAGWPRDNVRSAIAAYAEVDFPLPVPRPQAYVSPRDAFMHLVMFVALGMSACHLGSLLFGIINYLLPDAATPYDWAVRGEQTRIRWSIATLVVAFPIYLFVAARIGAETKADPHKGSSPVRKWLTYGTLFVATLTVIGDLVFLVNGFLSGDLTLRVGLKVLVVGIIAGAVFAYYIRTARQDEEGLK